MRKIALSIASLAVLFFASASAGSASWSDGHTRLESTQGTAHVNQRRPDWELGHTPILAHHLQEAAVQETLGAGPDAHKEDWVRNKDTECDIHLHTAGSK